MNFINNYDLLIAILYDLSGYGKVMLIMAEIASPNTSPTT